LLLLSLYAGLRLIEWRFVLNGLYLRVAKA